jgi:hypothetical protein
MISFSLLIACIAVVTFYSHLIQQIDVKVFTGIVILLRPEGRSNKAVMQNCTTA